MIKLRMESQEAELSRVISYALEKDRFKSIMADFEKDYSISRLKLI